MIRSASHDSVSRLVAERSMCFATASDKAFEKIDCMIAILCCQAKNRLYESSQRLIQPRRVRWVLSLLACRNQAKGEIAMRYTLAFSAALLLASQAQPALSQGAIDLVKQAVTA